MVALAASGARASDEGALRFSGSAKESLTLLQPRRWMDDSDGSAWDTILRPRLFWEPAASLSVEAVEELDFRRQKGADRLQSLLDASSSVPYRWSDPQRSLASSGNGERLLQNLDRLSATLHLGPWDLTAGRQVVSFGVSRAVNPTDVIAPLSLQNPDRENRLGVDALRAHFAWGGLGEVDGGFVAGKDARWSESAVFLQPHLHLGGVDASPLGMVFRKNLLWGGDLQGSVLGAGTWVEGAFVRPPDGEKPYARLSLGLDGNLTPDLYGYVEYHYNGAGEGRPEDFVHPSHLSAYESGSVFLLGRSYLIPSFQYQASALVTFHAQLFINLRDSSFWMLPHVEYNALKNFYIDASAGFPNGTGIRSGGPSSEWGLYPQLVFLYSRYYF